MWKLLKKVQKKDDAGRMCVKRDGNTEFLFVSSTLTFSHNTAQIFFLCRHFSSPYISQFIQNMFKYYSMLDLEISVNDLNLLTQLASWKT